MTATQSTPNFMMIISDDHRWCDIGAYGNADVHMPNVDRLASEGMRFENCFTTSPMCAPARMSLFTGAYPVRHGGWPNHSRCYDGTRSMVHHLQALGYRVGLHGKGHIGPQSVFPFEKVADVEAFIQRDHDKPFCLIIATREPHSPWGDHDADQYDPATLALTPNLLDTPGTRLALARYYSALSRLDVKVGSYLDLLKNQGQEDDTVIMYTSDHGSQFPGGKWTCYQPGLRIPFILRWPGRIEPGTTRAAMIQNTDILPTMVELAGGDPTTIDVGLPGAPDGGSGFDGRSFTSVLTGKLDRCRDEVFGLQTQHGTRNGLPYPTRSVSNGSYSYIINLCHESVYQNALTDVADGVHENEYWQEWLDAATHDPRARALVDRYLHRPPIEMYDLAADPWELNNVVDNLALRSIRDGLAKKLGDWMTQQGDAGLDTELAALTRRLH